MFKKIYKKICNKHKKIANENFNNRDIVYSYIIVLLLIISGTLFIYGNILENKQTKQTLPVKSVVSDIYKSEITPTVMPTIKSSPTSTITSTINPTKKSERSILPTVDVSRGDSDRNKLVDFRYIDTFVGSITKYTLHPSECGKLPSHPEYGITASGKYVTEHQTVAMGKQIPFGSKIRIEGFNEIFTVEDRGGAITNLCVDVYVKDRQEAFDWGRRAKRVWILSYGHN